MAFYGRVTNESKTSMTFDRVYPNKAAMDAGARDGDGVFSGRFVLVEYGNTTEEYSTNYNIDRDASPNHEIGRGYDSTVWRKVIANDGTAKYTMLAELNSVVPSFGIVVDPPTNKPAPPHFGKDSSNVYYPLHVQAPWGFKVAEAEDNKSDVPIKHYTAFNTSNEAIEGLEEYQGAIYFNSDGFDARRTHHVDEENFVKLEPAKSGATYGDPATAQDDMQQLSISLPVIGNAMSDAYDIMYGKDEPGRNRRNQDMRWLDANKQINNKFEGEDEALRLVYNIPNEVALDYVPEDAESLAGSINAVHDIMGMIITTDERPAAAEAFRDQIYYEKYAVTNDADRAIDKQYYTKVNGEYIPLTEDDPWDTSNTYYELAGKYYCVVPTAGYREEPVDTTWTVEQFKENLPQFDDAPITGLKQYDKKGFVLEDNTPTYVLRKSEHAAPGELYYSIPTHLDYAGNMSGSIDYIANGKNYVHVKTTEATEGRYEVLKNGDGPTAPEMYKIALVTVGGQLQPAERFNSTTEYFTYNELSKIFVRDRSVTADNFNSKVNDGLYAKSAKSGFAINRNSTIYYVKYTTTSNTINMKKLSSINSNGNNYKVKLNSLTEFIEFLKDGANASETLDATSLYIQGEAYEDADGNINYKYVRYPLNKFIFGPVDSGTADFSNIYKRESVTVDGQQYYNYIRATYNDFNVEGGSGNTGTSDQYQWYQLDVTTSNRWVPGEFWTVTLQTEAEKEELKNKQIAGELEDGIDTEDYNIIKIRKDWNPKPTPTEVYFSIPDGQDFSPVGYGIASKIDEEKESDPDLNLYYSPNTLYEKKANGKYVIADTAYNFVEGESELYRVNELYIIDVGDLKDSLILWSRWNNDLIQTTDDIAYYFKPTAQGGHGVKIGYKFDDFEWKELKGFARDLNTIHGWIIKLNRLINTDDFKTRDTSTLQGCINSINDILAKFDELPPGGLLGTNKFGQISTISFSGDSGHITVTTTFNENTNSPNYGQPEVSIAHADVLTTTAGEFGESANKSVSFGESFKVLNATVDAKGHLTTLRARTITLPAPDAGATTLSTYSYTYSATDSTLGAAIANSDNLTTAIEKLQWQIDHHENDVDKIQTDADVNAAVMSSFTTTGISGIVTTTDSLATAIGKLQVQINALVGAGSAANAIGTFSSSGSGNNVAALTVSDGILTASLNNLTEVTLAGFTQGASTAAIAAGDTLGTALSKLQANITAMTGSEYVFTSVQNNYAKIFRQPNEPPGNDLKSGWIWINTANGYVYFYTGSAWELLNSWQ